MESIARAVLCAKVFDIGDLASGRSLSVIRPASVVGKHNLGGRIGRNRTVRSKKWSSSRFQETAIGPRIES